MLQAKATSDGPNHTAANLEGTDRTKAFALATTNCPKKATQKECCTAMNFIQAPPQVNVIPNSTVLLRPYKCLI